MTFLLVGNYGSGNLGDELLREAFLHFLPEVHWTVVSAAGERGTVPRLPFGLRSLLTTPWWRTFGALRRSRGMVLGGGTLLTDLESPRAPLLWWWHAFIAWMLGKPVLLAFQGIGPFRTRVGEWCARWTVARAVHISVRDTASADRIATWKKSTNVVASSDPVFALVAGGSDRQERSPDLLVLIPRHTSTARFRQRARELARGVSGGSVRILSMQPDDSAEQETCRLLALDTGGSIIRVRTLADLTAALRPAFRVLTQRYHGAVAARALNVPLETVPMEAGDKLSACADADVHICRERAARGFEELRKALRNLA